MNEFEDWVATLPTPVLFRLADGTDKMRSLGKERLVRYVLTHQECRTRALDSYNVEQAVVRWKQRTSPWTRREMRIRYGLVGEGTLV